MNFIFANLAGGCDGHIQIDVAVAGVQIDVGGQVSRHFEGDGAIAAFEAPARGQSRAGGGSRVDAAISSFEFEFVEAAVGADVAIAGQSPELAVHFVNLL